MPFNWSQVKNKVETDELWSAKIDNKSAPPLTIETIERFIEETFKGCKPYAYLGKCPVYVSDSVPKGKILVIGKKDSACLKTMST